MKFLKSLKINDNSLFEDFKSQIEQNQEDYKNLNPEFYQQQFEIYKKEGEKAFLESSEKKKKKDKK